LSAAIERIDRQVDAAIVQRDEEVARQTTFRALITILCTIPGVSTPAAITILAEIGCDMSRFPTAGHLVVARSGLCPGHNESAGKRESSRLRKGAPWLKTMLVRACARAVTVQLQSCHPLSLEANDRDLASGPCSRTSASSPSSRIHFECPKKAATMPTIFSKGMPTIFSKGESCAQRPLPDPRSQQRLVLAEVRRP
jgi:hypothetical protein